MAIFSFLSGLAKGAGEEYSKFAVEEREKKEKRTDLTIRALQDQIDKGNLTPDEAISNTREILRMRGFKPEQVEQLLSVSPIKRLAEAETKRLSTLPTIPPMKFKVTEEGLPGFEQPELPPIPTPKTIRELGEEREFERTLKQTEALERKKAALGEELAPSAGRAGRAKLTEELGGVGVPGGVTPEQFQTAVMSEFAGIKPIKPGEGPKTAFAAALSAKTQELRRNLTPAEVIALDKELKAAERADPRKNIITNHQTGDTYMFDQKTSRLLHVGNIGRQAPTALIREANLAQDIPAYVEAFRYRSMTKEQIPTVPQEIRGDVLRAARAEGIIILGQKQLDALRDLDNAAGIIDQMYASVEHLFTEEGPRARLGGARLPYLGIPLGPQAFKAAVGLLPELRTVDTFRTALAPLFAKAVGRDSGNIAQQEAIRASKMGPVAGMTKAEFTQQRAFLKALVTRAKNNIEIYQSGGGVGGPIPTATKEPGSMTTEEILEELGRGGR